MKLIINDFEANIKDLAKDAEEVKVMIAFLTKGGLNWLPEEKINISEFIIGLDLGIKESGAIKHLMINKADVYILKKGN